MENITLDEMTTEGYWSSRYSARMGRFYEKVFKLYYFKYLPRTYINSCFFSLCGKYLDRTPNKKIIEIGSAPGWRLREFKSRFNRNVFGVEFSKNGYILNRNTFLMSGINPDHCIYDDFRNTQFQEKYKEYFDVVMSFGFIEHFRSPDEMVKLHLSLLKKGGVLILSVPNMEYVNDFLTRIFCNSEIRTGHNKEIMRLENFKNLFSNIGLETFYLDYFGTFNFCLFMNNRNVFTQLLSILLLSSQAIIDILFRIALRGKDIRCKLINPDLLYIGKKYKL